MSEKKNKLNNRKKTTIGILSIVLGISFLTFNYFDKKIDYAYSYMNNSIFAYNETKKEKPQIKEEEEEVETVHEDNIDPNPYDSDYNYIGTLEIPKIGFKRGFVDINSTDNNVDQNISIMQGSSFPNVSRGNLIIAGHSGTAWNSFFNDLYKVEKGDVIYVYYQNVKYTYVIVNIYNVQKTGTVDIYRDGKKTTVTLITCKNDSDTEQTIYVGELTKKAEY